MGWFADLMSNPMLDQSQMETKPNGKRKGDWLQPATEWVSDAIPNEFSKLSNNWTGNIPYIGWVLRGLAGGDNFAETYSNTGDLGASAEWGVSGFMGNAGDPYKYSPKNQAGLSGDWGSDWAGNLGKILNVAGSYKGGNYGSGAKGTVGLFSKYDKNNAGYYPMQTGYNPEYTSMLGKLMSQFSQPRMSSYPNYGMQSIDGVNYV